MSKAAVSCSNGFKAFKTLRNKKGMQTIRAKKKKYFYLQIK